MNEWLEFASTPTPPNPDAPLSMVAMRDHRLLQVSGRDAASFLQGQLTCDLRRLEQCEVLLGAHCNAKGRMISSAVVAQIDEGSIGLRVRANIAEGALAALKKYIVFSKAEITPADQVAIALMGDAAVFKEQSAQLPFGEWPSLGHSMIGDGFTLLHHSSGLLEIWATPDRAMTLWRQLLPFATVSCVEELERHWINHGIAEIQAAIAEEFIPQMLNYQLIDGVSFKKGCYTGQEIVARMQYRGQLKKHAYRVSSDAPDGPAVGEELAAESEPQKNAAVVVAGAGGANGWTGLVVATSEVHTSEPYLVSKNSGAKFQWATLPYAIP